MPVKDTLRRPHFQDAVAPTFLLWPTEATTHRPAAGEHPLDLVVGLGQQFAGAVQHLPRHAQEIERIETEAKDRTRMHEGNWQTALDEAIERRSSWPKLMEEKWRLAAVRLDQSHACPLSRMYIRMGSSVGKG